MAIVVIDTGEVVEAGRLVLFLGSLAVTVTVKEPAKVKAWLAMTAEELSALG